MFRELLRGLRWLRKNPLFTAVVAATLALGIGATTAVFSVVDAVLLRPLPYAAPARLIGIAASAPRQPSIAVPTQEYLRRLASGDLFELLAAYRYDVVTLTGIEAPEQVLSIRASGSLFSVLGVRARLGRTLVESDDRPGAPLTAVLSDKVWRAVFHADPGVIGKTVRAGEEPLTIVGVMPPEFEFPAPDKEMWLPLQLDSAATGALSAVGRMKGSAGVAQANLALAVLAHQLEQEDPATRSGLKILATAWSEEVTAKSAHTLVFILSAAGLLLLIACANVASLMLSRAVQRQKEIAVRACLGAGFWRVVRQLLAESLVLAVIGSAAGVAVAVGLLRYLSKRIAALPVVMPHMQQATITGRVLVFNAAVCLLVSCLFSVVPVLVAAKLDLQTSLKSGRGVGRGRGSSRLFSSLIACEAGLSFLLLAGAGLMVRSLIRLQESDHGFRPDHVLTLRVPIGSLMHQRPTGFETKPLQMAYFHRLLDRLQSTPGVQAVAVVNNLPLSGYNTTLDGSFKSANGESASGVRARTVSEQYFAAMGIPLLAGRVFTDADREGSRPVVIVNEYMAHILFPKGGAVGQPVETGGRTATVVGVVKDSAQMAYDTPPQAEVYLPYQQTFFGAFLATVVVRTEGDPRAVAGALQKGVWEVNRDQPIVKVETMNDVIADSIWRPRFSSWVLSVISGLALLLMSAGVYGVIAYTASLRAPEIGIRVALGAGPRMVAGVIVRDALIPVLAGLVLSAAAALLLHRLLASLLYGISSADPFTYASAGAVLLAVGIVASAGPAWRAATADPVKALRSE
ncbi:MAG TPA: ABC transporter permease [Bryobacteraceae bacterium]|nr:ABC transporter permease [Bryobacteraceae bacterium]